MVSFWKKKADEPSAEDGGRTAAQRTAYEAKKTRERDRQATKSKAGRDIGEPPAVKDPARRARAEASFRLFCETYFPERFTLKWSRDHLRVIERIETTVKSGGLFAIAMPRGSGKTSLCEVACLWALFCGYRKFVLLIGASAAAAEENLDSLKKEIEVNEVLAEDFPEVCFPIKKLEGGANLCARQLSNGQRTQITYGKKVLVLPTIAGSKASGGILRVAGITGRLRGMKFTRSDGQSVRPDLVIPDDPQTDASAKSEPQCAHRERLLAGAVLGLAGPAKKIAAIMPCTVIRRGDMADAILDRKRHPEWHGERCQLVYAFPTNEKLWDEYAEIRAASMRNGGDGSEATAFYKKNRKAMDAGADLAWPERFEPGELSGLQYAINLRLKDEAAFQAEYQQDPRDERPDDAELLSPQAIAEKVNGLARGVVPLSATRLTLFTDVQHKLLYWAIGAFSDDFNGAIVDYGTWPDQGRTYFTYRSIKKTLQTVYGGASIQAAVRAGLEALHDHLFEKAFTNEAGTELHIERGLIDAADGSVTDVVFEYCRTSKHAARLMPTHGKGIGPTDVPMHAYKPKEGERLGFHYVIQPVPKRAFRQVLIDANYWKSFTHERLATPLGDKGSLSLFGDERTDHRLLSEHLTAEYRERIHSEKTQRSADVWKQKPAKPDNHWLDCVAGTAVAASIGGSSILPRQATPKRRRIEVTF